ncbi:hypothetical protein [Epilithonimonas arachidiradicis]|uniref:Uncharacterized protein n=1 Tax=Epilithonimonas arachidiradicis TaxID=1617282 RepID=A0A420DCN4_9FLAO|nr:hypothetical protein [Epilithonimonas arachidiradicis]RKE89564.1 hypothetical protein BXY58_0133 [Epilithonimonas arachidiradicis]GGG43500.1 hypothetical protein GCM10007332_01230 [Epilithonimonas arachidiradicis]
MKIIIMIFLSVSGLLSAQKNKSGDFLQISYNKFNNMLKVKNCSIAKSKIDNRLWLFDDEYPDTSAHFILEVYSNNVKILPETIDISVLPDGDINLNYQKYGIPKMDSIKDDEFYFKIIDDKTKHSALEFNQSTSGSLNYFNFKEGHKYILVVNLVSKNQVIARSNKIELIY